jgi:hypothetical protein
MSSSEATPDHYPPPSPDYLSTSAIRNVEGGPLGDLETRRPLLQEDVIDRLEEDEAVRAGEDQYVPISYVGLM